MFSRQSRTSTNLSLSVRFRCRPARVGAGASGRETAAGCLPDVGVTPSEFSKRGIKTRVNGWLRYGAAGGGVEKAGGRVLLEQLMMDTTAYGFVPDFRGQEER